jgi:hypothetical protein
MCACVNLCVRICAFGFVCVCACMSVLVSVLVPCTLLSEAICKKHVRQSKGIWE